MWHKLELQWQEAFKLAWSAFQSGTIPIGAVIYRGDKKISDGRNRIFDEDLNHPLAGLYMGHAEMDAMLNLKGYTDKEIRSFTLYSTMEPCPMCFSTMYMMHIKNLKYAANDKFAGSTNLIDKTWYFKEKTMDIEHKAGRLQAFQLILQTTFEYKRDHKFRDRILNRWSLDDERAVTIGKRIYEDKGIMNKVDQMSVEEFFHLVMELYDS